MVPSNFQVARKSMDFLLCETCGYSFCKENFKDYVALGAKDISNPKRNTRVGDGINPGREFFMAIDMIDFFLKKNSSQKKVRILIFAPGNSLDHQLLRKHKAVAECVVTDLRNFQDSEYFVPLETNKKFDIVIACEVAEHFMYPRKEFANLLRYIGNEGILVISTSMRQHKNLSYSLYPFLFGHTSYYSEESLVFLSKMNNVFVNFRVPVGETFNSKTKRYIYMTKSAEVQKGITHFFSEEKVPRCE